MCLCNGCKRGIHPAAALDVVKTADNDVKAAVEVEAFVFDVAKITKNDRKKSINKNEENGWANGVTVQPSTRSITNLAATSAFDFPTSCA